MILLTTGNALVRMPRSTQYRDDIRARNIMVAEINELGPLNPEPPPIDIENERLIPFWGSKAVTGRVSLVHYRNSGDLFRPLNEHGHGHDPTEDNANDCNQSEPDYSDLDEVYHHERYQSWIW